MPYRLHRPRDRKGCGPLAVYRAISVVEQPLLQQPLRWVRSQPAFQALGTNPTPEIAKALKASSVANVDKVWTELAFESARLEVAPDRPSRLDSVYAFADPLEALSFTELTGEAKHVWEGTVQDGVPWAVVDMNAFEIIVPRTPDEQGYQETWDSAVAKGRAYWAPLDRIAVAEVLVLGPVVLTRRLELLPLLRTLGLVETGDP